jgi:polysaccharide export outer membrane protein
MINGISRIAFLSVGVCLVLGVFSACASTGNVETVSAASIGKFGDVETSDFVLGIGDTVSVTVYRHDDFNTKAKIDTTGKMTVPLIGDLDVYGKTVYRVRDELTEKFSQYIKNPQIILSIESVVSHKVLVMGEVKSPGVFTFENRLYLSELISMAGGFGGEANKSNVGIIRRKGREPMVILADYKAILKGDLDADVAMQSGDIVFVPTSTISDVSKFMGYVSNILAPFINVETGIIMYPSAKDVLQGKEKSTDTIIAP